MATSSNLRDTLLASLSTLPGTRDLHLHVLVTSPRKHSGLFPFAQPRPRCYLQDVVVLLSEQPTPDAPRIFVCAIEACIYTIPASSCAVLYISKVDTTGQGLAPSPTASLVRAFLEFYADPKTRPFVADHLWIHLFARAQNQYLFPNSSEFEGKRPLSDVKLCAWWKRLYSEVAEKIQSRLKEEAGGKIRLYYLLPGSTETEATYSLKFASSSNTTPPHPSSLPWSYGHPYSQSEIQLPCSVDNSEGCHNLGQFIPSFDDDPKSRFLDEIAYTTDADGIKSPVRKRPRKESDAIGEVEGLVEGKERQHTSDKPKPPGELTKVSPEEFWERMSFRQECIAGILTGFFIMAISCTPSKDVTRSEASPLAPQVGQVSAQMVKRVMTSLLTGVEFSTVERAIRGTGIVEDSIKGLCDGLQSPPDAPNLAASTVIPSSSQLQKSDRLTTPEPESKPQSLAPPQTPPPRLKNGKRVVPDVSPNPFPEPVASLETYNSHIYGSIHIENASLPSKPVAAETVAPKVTILAVRKKKKRA
ncbi:hypothetical protein FIBSPDRAFT_810818 [Athelia psychrophila]|uniref:histone acetyltransferase n=1 Tax=Athelia psychrophila TaxID=1759441 RepID=A0A166W9C7_9AGAM|nr:hypothetical protein FIBSPDRAFT_810818 [Fibularhizoctonia sp. CBS 109695]